MVTEWTCANNHHGRPGDNSYTVITHPGTGVHKAEQATKQIVLIIIIPWIHNCHNFWLRNRPDIGLRDNTYHIHIIKITDAN